MNVIYNGQNKFKLLKNQKLNSRKTLNFALFTRENLRFFIKFN